MSERDDMIKRAKKLRADITDIFLDADHWNNIHPTVMPINPDPDGDLQRIVDAIDRMLLVEGQRAKTP